jgi:hypothetical protein
MLSVVALDWTADGAGVAPTGGLPGFGAVGGTRPDGFPAEGGVGAGAVCPGVVGGAPRLAGGGGAGSEGDGVGSGGDGTVGSGDEAEVWSG